MQWANEIAESGLAPDRILRIAIRMLLRKRLRSLGETAEEATEASKSFIASLKHEPAALSPELANDQHYEVPAAYYEHVLGPHLKYSCCVFNELSETLADGEENALKLVVERAKIADGMTVLDLGCGWGSFTLYAARQFPNCQITAVSNSASQGAYIRSRLEAENLTNVNVLTADMNTFAPAGNFDRIVSIEMFEHMRNWPLLFNRMSQWLQPDGAVFLHFFCHNEFAYPYKPEGAGNWMARTFFSGGMMPNFSLPRDIETALEVDAFWKVDGVHYERTCREWLKRHRSARREIVALFETVYGPGEGIRWYHRWRLFYLACAELFGYRRGDEWYVAHYRLRQRGAAPPPPPSPETPG